MSAQLTRSVPRRRRIRRVLRKLILGAAGLAAALVTALVIAVCAVPYPVDRLSIDDGGPLILTDRHGTVLRSVPGPPGRPGRQSWVGLDDIPAPVVLAVITSEDRNFFDHAGVDPEGVIRALLLDLRLGRFAYGGSTITMQLARMLHTGDGPRTLRNKIRESIYALRMERAVDKRTILEQYLNRAYYGNGAYGIEAAARRYFGKPAVGLSLAEAMLLAVIPRAPTGYDPVRHLSAAMRRRDYVLDLLVDQGLLAADVAARTKAEPVVPSLHQPPLRALHFTEWVLQSLPAEVRARGGTVRTTLDLPLQEQLAHRVREHVAGLATRNLQQAGMVVLDSQRGEVLALIGSTGEGPDHAVDITTWRRHPGSALKPFIYALAIEAGDHPASIAHDIYSDRPGYQVIDRNRPEHGPVRYREALAGSYNLAAVDVLGRVGVGQLMSMLRRAGVGPLEGTPDDYGLRLALGSAKVRLLDLASAYGFLVRGGQVVSPTGVLDARSDDGRVWHPPARISRRITSPETAWLVMDMLADPEARRPAFGQELPFDHLPFRVAAKTGTSRGFADTVAVGATAEYTVAAWAGNFDGSPTQGLVAMQSAAPLVRAGLLLAGRGQRLTLPARPDAVVGHDVCPLSGKRPSAYCPHRKREYAAASGASDDSGASGAGHDHGADEVCDWHRLENGRVIVEYPPEARDWAERERRRGGWHARTPARSAISF